jgi:hypothetical protein
MHWALAFLVIRLINIPLRDILPAFTGYLWSYASSYNQYVYMCMFVLLIYQLFQNFLWLLFTSRRYFIGIVYTIYCVIRAIVGLGYETYYLKKMVDEINQISYYSRCTANPYLFFFVGLVLVGGVYYLFYRRNYLEIVNDKSDTE